MTDFLDTTAKRLDGGAFSTQPEIRAELERIIGGNYLSQGKTNLGNRHLREYVTLQSKLYNKNDPRTIEASATEAWLLFNQESIAESEKLYRQVLPLVRKEQQKGNIKPENLVTA